MGETTGDGPTDEARAEQIIAELRRVRGEQLAPEHTEFEWAAHADPDFMEAYARFSSWIWDPPGERALSARERSLIWIVLLANRGFHQTLPAQMRKAMAAGATKQQILEALEIAVLPAGAPAMHLGLRALREIEDDE